MKSQLAFIGNVPSHLCLLRFSHRSHSRQLSSHFHRGNHHLWKSLPTHATIPPLVFCVVLHKILKPEHYNRKAEDDDLNNRCYDWQTTTHNIFTILSAAAAGNKEKNVSSSPRQHKHNTSSFSTLHFDQHREHWYSTSSSC